MIRNLLFSKKLFFTLKAFSNIMVIGWVACVATMAYGEGGANARVRRKKNLLLISYIT